MDCFSSSNKLYFPASSLNLCRHHSIHGTDQRVLGIPASLVQPTILLFKLQLNIDNPGFDLSAEVLHSCPYVYATRCHSLNHLS
ncbi:rCG42245 [Rattus norvegicus]|uniref:RCG42245 n=1 Tax=Rattus norvegicus TaxID=10116 RepID=A6KUH7_RAT|nr:rCG42245 [Rattus norvegicus]